MIVRVETTDWAERDFWSCYQFIAKRSSRGAESWARAFRSAVLSLVRNPHRGRAPESADHDEEILQVIFKTRKGLPYRFLFIVRGETAFVIHVRGPGQDLMTPDEIHLPNGGY